MAVVDCGRTDLVSDVQARELVRELIIAATREESIISLRREHVSVIAEGGLLAGEEVGLRIIAEAEIEGGGAGLDVGSSAVVEFFD